MIAAYPPTEDAIVYYLNHLQNKQFNIQQYFVYIVPLYIFGLLIQALVCTKDYYQIKRLKKSAIETSISEWMDSFQLYIEKLAIKRKVRLMISDRIEVPVAIGYFKPIVLLPIAYVNQIPLTQAQALILHELSHIKRNDYLKNLIKVCIETMLFFNPFIWLLSKHIHTEREQACDDIVTGLLPNHMSYAKALLAAELLKHTQPPKWSLAATGNNYKLLHRIKRITNIKMETAYTTTKHQLFTLMLVIGILMSLAWIQPQPLETSIEPVNKKISTQIEQNFEEVIITISDSIKPISPTLVKINQDTSKITSAITKPSESAEWKTQLADIQKYAELLKTDFESAEWKDYLSSLAKEAQALEKINSSEWKAQLAEAQKHADRFKPQFESSEWKDYLSSLAKEAQALEKFNAPEWKAKIAVIEENAKKIEEKFNSPEWKAAIEENTKKIEKKFNSPEWKAAITSIEENAKKVAEKFNSPEWKAKINKLEEKARKFEEQNN